MVEILTQFYTAHYNFGLIALFILLFAALLGSRKNVKGVIAALCVFLVYNLVLFKKTERDPEWYDKKEAEIRDYDPVKKLWEDKDADDDPNKYK